jgi:predicted TIM-barrel fold metal-dependent hydrolase
VIIPKLISADSHVVEPPDLWTSRMARKYGERAPHQVRMAQGDAWAFPNTSPFPFGLVQCGGLPPREYRLWVHWEEVRKETYEPAARLQSQDRSGVRAEVLYPSPRIAIAIYTIDSDPDYQMACVTAYNDWLSEHCALAPQRLIGLAMVPGTGLESAMREAQRAIKLAGIGGLLLNRYPAGGLRLSPQDDRFFQWCAETGIPVHIHVGLAGSESGMPPQANEFVGAFTGVYRFYDPPIRMSEMIYTGLLDRVPDISIVWAEVDVGWVGYLMEQLDDRIERQNPAERKVLRGRPSDYFRRNFYYTVVKDAYGIRNRGAVGAERIMWSSDFPHATCDYPDFASAIRKDFTGVADDELNLMLAGNAVRLYHLDAAEPRLQP